MLELSLRYFKEPVIDSQNVPPLGATKQTITLRRRHCVIKHFSRDRPVAAIILVALTPVSGGMKSSQTTAGFSQQQAD